MLLEQAFHALPEILCGSRYPGQEYESGVVTALTMAILQELNGRNVPNPLSCIQGERLYQPAGFPTGGKPRYLRADLVIDTRSLMVANKRLGGCYGWRHFNWLEAKFFRSRISPTNKTGPTASLVADLLRLATLVPETPGVGSENARYLLHVYDRPPTEYISGRRNKNQNGAAGKRQWATVVHAPGVHALEISDLNQEPPSFSGILGSMGELQTQLTITNVAVSPITSPAAAPQLQAPLPVYWCVLTRIDSIVCTDGTKGFTIASDRTVTEKSSGDLDTLRSKVALALGEVAETEEEEPEDPALAPDESAPV